MAQHLQRHSPTLAWSAAHRDTARARRSRPRSACAPCPTPKRVSPRAAPRDRSSKPPSRRESRARTPPSRSPAPMAKEIVAKPRAQKYGMPNSSCQAGETAGFPHRRLVSAAARPRGAAPVNATRVRMRAVSDDRCDLLCLDLPRAEDIRQHLDEAAIADAAARGKALGDPTRVTIAVALREGGELCVCDLAWITGRPENLVGHHLRTLRAAGLATSRREHKIVFYALDRPRHAPARRAPHPDRGRPMSTTRIELPIAPSTPVGQQQPDPGERDRLIRRAKALSWLSLAYMTAEGAIAITAAILAGSVALLGFGLDSAIEALASVIVIWRFTGDAPTLTRRRTTRPTSRRDQLLPTRPVHRPRRDPRPDRRRAPPHQLARNRPLDLQHHRHARPRQRQAPPRPAPRLPAPPPAKAPKTCSAPTSPPAYSHRLALNAAFGLWWADPTVALVHRRPRHQRRPPNLARPRLLRCPADPWRAEHAL